MWVNDCGQKMTISLSYDFYEHKIIVICLDFLFYIFPPKKVVYENKPQSHMEKEVHPSSVPSPNTKKNHKYNLSWIINDVWSNILAKITDEYFIYLSKYI